MANADFIYVLDYERLVQERHSLRWMLKIICARFVCLLEFVLISEELSWLIVCIVSVCTAYYYSYEVVTSSRASTLISAFAYALIVEANGLDGGAP